MNDLIIFDLDGVITSEEAYWDAAGLTLHELMYSPRYWGIRASKNYSPATTAEESRYISRSTLPESEIMVYKARSINSNWDTCYAAVCLRLIDALALLQKQVPGTISDLLPLRPWESDWIAAFREKITLRAGSLDTSLFDVPPFLGYTGLELINRFDVYASEVLEISVEGIFSRYSPLWAFCRDIFQEWYLGEELYTQTYGHAPAQTGKPGCIHFERPLLPLEEVRVTLERLREQGNILGFATGRVRQEAEYPLKMYDLLHYFDEQHISTYDDVERAEAKLRARGEQTLLSKPHSFPFLFAAKRDYENAITRPEACSGSLRHGSFVVVGDSTSDILGGHAAGALTVAVLTGVRTAEARTLLAQSEPDFTIEDMRQLPALLTEIDSLATIQHLQFTERKKAERLLLGWFARHMQLATESVTLMPRAVSLNSFNGIYRSDGDCSPRPVTTSSNHYEYCMKKSSRWSFILWYIGRSCLTSYVRSRWATRGISAWKHWFLPRRVSVNGCSTFTRRRLLERRAKRMRLLPFTSSSGIASAVADSVTITPANSSDSQ